MKIEEEENKISIINDLNQIISSDYSGSLCSSNVMSRSSS